MNPYELNEDQYISYVEDYINSHKSTFEDLYNDCKVGDMFDLNVYFIRPCRKSRFAEFGEWEEAKDGQGITTGPITIDLFRDRFICVDGHHRLYEAIKAGRSSIKVQIVERNITTRF